jgi:predicted transcriptional regulator of viral defense system
MKSKGSGLGAINAVHTRDTKIIYSSKARTLMDAVYDCSRFNSLPRGYDWIRRETKNDPKLATELIKVTIKYGNIATIRRIGYLFDIISPKPRMIKQLQSQLRASSALIPWIPGRPAKGTINRKWGIIVNG